MQHGLTCRLQRFQMPWQETLATIRTETGTVKALVDATGVGDPIVEALQRGQRNFEGFKFTSQSKQALMEGLAVAIQHGDVGYPTGWLTTELGGFEYVYTRTGVRYSAPRGCTTTVCVRWPWRCGSSRPSRRVCPPLSSSYEGNREDRPR